MEHRHVLEAERQGVPGLQKRALRPNRPRGQERLAGGSGIGLGLAVLGPAPRSRAGLAEGARGRHSILIGRSVGCHPETQEASSGY